MGALSRDVDGGFPPPLNASDVVDSPGENGVSRSPRAVSLVHSSRSTGLGAFGGVPVETSVTPPLRRFA